MNQPRILIMTLLGMGCVVGMLATAQTRRMTNNPASDTVTFTADVLVAPDATISLGGVNHSTAILRPNLPLLKRLLFEAGDLRGATVSLGLDVPKTAITVLAEGKATNGQMFRFADMPALQAVELRPDMQWILAVWRHQFHYSGGGELGEFRLERVADGKQVTLPVFGDQPVMETELGIFSLAGYTKRLKFPALVKRIPVAAGKGKGDWEVVDGKDVRLNSTASRLAFATRGMADWSPGYDPAPVLIFEAKQAGQYRLHGSLRIISGQASNPQQAETVSWMLLATEPGLTSTGATLKLHRLLREAAPAAKGVAALSGLAAGKDYDLVPVATVSFGKLSPGQKRLTVPLADFEKPLARWQSGEWADHGMLAMVEPDSKNILPHLMLAPKDIKGEVTIKSHPAHQVFANPLKPVTGTYVQVRDGHLNYGGQRLRLWGICGGPEGDARAADRLARLGFNAMRLWGQGGQEGKGAPSYDAASASKGQLRDPATYKTGERNVLDNYDRYFADLKQSGFFIVCPQLMSGIGWDYLVQDGSFVSAGADWEEWKAAIRTKATGAKKEVKAAKFWLAFDERLIQAQRQHARNFLNHVNPYTGKRYAEEEAVAIWEIHNEYQLVRLVLENGFDTWPDYFRNKLTARWNDWLKARYQNESALTTAWDKLEIGESLGGRTVKLAPIFSQREAFPKARADDFVEFITTLVARYYLDFQAFCRTQAPAGVGINVVPFSFDTQYRPNTPWHYSTAGQADVANFGMYFFPLTSSLGKPPGAYVMDSHTVAGKPTIIYETNESRPCAYRTGRAFINAALGAWQDWDAIFWHYYHSLPQPDEQFLALPLQYMTSTFYWSAVETERDPAMLSAIALAGRIFINGHIASASHPVTYQLGKRALFGYDLWNGVSMSRATFQRGAAVRFDPNGNYGVKIEGADAEAFTGRMEAAVASGEQVLWDWPNGRLIIDTPNTKAYVGAPPAQGGWYRFRDGISVGGLKHDFVALAIVSADDRPLVGAAPAKRIYLNARRDAHNTGFDIDLSVAKADGSFGDPFEQARRIRNRGHAPVVEDDVPFTVCFPVEISAQWRGYDFAQRQVMDRTVSGSNRLEYSGPALFMSTVDLSARGKAMETPQTTIVAIAKESNLEAAIPATGDAVLAKVWHPVPGITWADNYARVHRLLRQSSISFTTISKAEASPEAQTSIRLTDAKMLFNLPAGITIAFAQGKMQSLDVTFTRPPSLNEVVKAYEDKFGKPEQKQIANEQGSDTSLIQWHANMPGATLLIKVIETQGNLSIHYEIQPTQP
ncbi:MAG: beta-galactosidase [Verrucomicrobiota bacterium]